MGTSATDVGVAQFSSEEEAGFFLRSMSSLKNYIASYKDRYNSDAMTHEQWCEFLRTKWIPVTDLFIQKWGHHIMVPVDIRSSIDDIRRNLGMDAVTWPYLIRVDKN